MTRALLRVAHGPLAVEALLVADLLEHARARCGDPRALARTLTIVVPSESLRLHLAARLVAASGRALAGVRVTTLHGLAARVLELAGEPPPRGAPWFAILARRLARRESALARELERFERGFDATVASVSDFFDAGFELVHAEPLLEILGDPSVARRADPATVERARALVRVARALSRELDAIGAAHRSDELARATRALERDPSLSSGNEVWIRGFADVTGRAGDLIECLARLESSRVYADTATIPAGAASGSASFGQRFRERLAIEAAVESPAPPVAALFKAPGPEAEVRAVAERIRGLLDRGVAPESIGVVARDLEPLRLAIRRSFTRLAIPFSGVAARGSPGPVERRVEALFEVLRDPERASVERWLEARSLARADGDLLLALRSLGVGRLRALAELELARAPFRGEWLPLPVRRGSWSEDADVDEDSALRLARRRLHRGAIERARAAARTTLAALEAWSSKRPFESHRERFEAILSEAFGWTAETPGAEELQGAEVELAREMGGLGALERVEFLELVLEAWRERSAPRIGGAGGGVQVLSVVEGRARTFGHLFLVSLNRGAFPRRVREDPLLPDALRGALTALLPDLPLKALGHEEERALFEELVRSSANVTLSWQTIDEDGGVRQPSTFLDAFVARAPDDVETVPAVYDPARPRTRATRPAHEALVIAALAGQHERYERLLPVAFQEVSPHAESAELARATLAILRELDTPAHVRPGLTPYLGLVGAVRGERDPRRRELFVTTLEGLADCGWRTFLRTLLQLEPPPDPLDALPAIDPRIVGEFVHRVLHAIASPSTDALPATLAEAAERAPRRIAWPDARALEPLLLSTAEALLLEEGLTLRGFAHVLADEARPLLAAARAIDESDPPIGACGSEVEGELRFAGTDRILRFRADRVDRSVNGLRLVDFKTGKPISENKREKTRDAKLTAQIASGSKLQAAAYAFAAGAGAEGRYAFLSPRLAGVARVVSVSAGDRARRETFERTVSTLIDALDAGAFVPRLLNAKLDQEHRHCAHCELAEACVRGDSGFRARIADWARASPPDAGSEPAHRVWHLGAAAPAATEDEES